MTHERQVRLGWIQKRILEYIDMSPGGYFGPMVKSELFAGMCWEEVEPSLERLLTRGIIKRVSHCRYERVGCKIKSG